MGLLKRAFYITIVSIFLISCTCKEEKIKDEEEKIKDEFIIKIGNELKLLQKQENEKRVIPKCEPVGSPPTYLAFYRVFTGMYTYDILRTNSIVSPYVAGVTFRCIEYRKRGGTMQDCLNNKWESDGKVKNSREYNYAYQDGEWRGK